MGEGPGVILSSETFLSFINQLLLTMWITINWKIMKEMGIPDHLTSERVTGRKARGLQMEEIACKCQTF